MVDKKQYLKRYLRIGKKIESLEEKLFRIDAQLTSVPTKKLSDMPRGAQPVTMADMVADKLETQDRINRLCVEREAVRKEILAAIDTLEDAHQVEVLERFFLEGETLENIAKEIGYTPRHTIRLYTNGIALLLIDE